MPRPTFCRDCGERITEAPNAHLPGYCGPCSIPEQQAREDGRITRYRPHTRVLRHAFGWTFILDGVYSTGTYRTRAIARARMAFHKAQRTAFYYAHTDKAGAP